MKPQYAGMGVKHLDFRSASSQWLQGPSGPSGVSGGYVRTSQVDLAAGQAFSTFSECDTCDAAMSGAFDVGANSTLEEFRPSTVHPASTLKTQWWFVCLDMTP